MGFQTAHIGQSTDSTTGPRIADHALSAQVLAAHKDDSAWLNQHLPGCVHPWLDGYTCAYCELPVRSDVDHRHPGYGVVEHADPATVDDPDSELRVLHRFCGRMLHQHALPGSQLAEMGVRYGVALRRAWLGWATDQFLAGVKELHFGFKHYERLGLHPGKLRSPALFRKYWLVRKMQCASHAVHYYAGKHLPTQMAKPFRGAK